MSCFWVHICHCNPWQYSYHYYSHNICSILRFCCTLMHIMDKGSLQKILSEWQCWRTSRTSWNSQWGTCTYTRETKVPTICGYVCLYLLCHSLIVVIVNVGVSRVSNDPLAVSYRPISQAAKSWDTHTHTVFRTSKKPNEIKIKKTCGEERKNNSLDDDPIPCSCSSAETHTQKCGYSWGSVHCHTT